VAIINLPRARIARRHADRNRCDASRSLTVLQRRGHNFLRHGARAEGVERLNDHAVTRELLQVRQMMLPPGHGCPRQTQGDAGRGDTSLHGFVRVLLRAQPEFHVGMIN